MWFTETPWPPIGILALTSFILVAMWVVNRRGPYLIGVCVCVLASAGIYIFESLYETQGELVEKHVLELSQAVQSNDIEATLGYLSQSAIAERAIVGAMMMLVTVEPGLRVTDMQVKMFAEQTRAESEFRANGQFTGFGVNAVHHPTRWRLTWQKEGDDWKVIKIERMDVVTGESISLKDPR